RVGGQAEVVVGGERGHRAAVEHAGRPPGVEAPVLPPPTLGPQRRQLVVDPAGPAGGDGVGAGGGHGATLAGGAPRPPLAVWLRAAPDEHPGPPWRSDTTGRWPRPRRSWPVPSTTCSSRPTPSTGGASTRRWWRLPSSCR